MSDLLSLRQTLQRSYQDHPRRLELQLAYLVVVVGIAVFFRAFWTPDTLFFLFLGWFVIAGLGKEYLRYFGPFVVLLLSYDSLRSLIPLVNSHVHYFPMINFDRWLGHGTLPTVWLQQHLYNNHIHWYDYYFLLLYLCHFLSPLLVALIIWRLRPQFYWRYVAAFVALSYAGFATYLAFPAAPPWMASALGLIPHVQQISSAVWWSLGVQAFPTIYQHLDPNNVAAVPSLHAAYPTLMWLFIAKAFGRRIGLALAWYPLSVYVGVVYLGEHYVFDVCLGILYAFTAYGLTNALAPHVARWWHSRVAQWQSARAKLTPTPVPAKR